MTDVGGQSDRRARRLKLLAYGCLLAVLAPNFGAAPSFADTPAATALPTGGNVTSGQVSISVTDATMNVTQSTQKASINWNTFNVGAQAQVNFNQPNASAQVLNRVVGVSASQIYGKINANGQVIIINPNGVVFAEGSQINAAGIVASTLDLTDANFNNGQYRFERNGATGEITNQGTLTAVSGGYVALLGVNVTNKGVIAAPAGSVALVAGDTVEIPLTDSGLISIEATLPDDQTLGTVEVVENGLIDVSSAEDVGGTATLLGNRVGLLDKARIDASGNRGGGTVRVGDDYQGQNVDKYAWASAVVMGANATIDASAIESGDGGQVVLWSGEYAGFFGKIFARGGALGGNGGLVETSGHQTLTMLGSVDVSAVVGLGGTWLLDPADVVISSSATSDVSGAPSYIPTGDSATSYILNTEINAALDAGTNVVIVTGGDAASGPNGGSITVSAPISATTGTAGVTGSLTLSASTFIVVNSSITMGDVGVTGGGLTLRSRNADGATGYINIGADVAISTNGGNITMGGGSGELSAGNGFAIGSGVYNSTTNNGIYLVSSTTSLDAGGGNIVLNGQGGASAYGAPYNGNVGIWSNGIITTSGDGTITLTGKGIEETRCYSGDYDIRLGGPGTSAGVTAGSASNITLVGIGTGVTDGGLYFYNSDGGVLDYDILSTWTMTQLCGLSFNSSIVKSAGGDASWTLTSSAGRITFLNTGGGITSTSGALSITLDAGQFVSLATSGVLTSNGGTITLSAASYIMMGASTQITSGGGDIVYRSRSGDAAAGYIYLDSGSVTTSGGGNITLGGGSGALSAGNGFAVGSGVYNQPTNNGIYLASSTTSLNAGGGNIVLNGQGGLTTYGAPYNGNVGIWSNGIITTSGAGTITLTGKGIQETRNYSGDYDIRLGGPGTSAGVTAGSASNITLVGIGTGVTDGGLYFYNSEGGVLDYDILSAWTMTQLCGLSFNSSIVKSTGGDASWTLTSTSGRITFLNTGGGITSTSGALNITLDAGQYVYLATSGILNSNGGTITLSAASYITMGASTQITSGGGDIVYRSRSGDAAAGNIYLDSGSVTTSSGGNITLGGGSGALSAGNGFAVGSGVYNQPTNNGIYLASSTTSLNAGGGNIVLNGQGGLTTYGAPYNGNVGIWSNGIITTSGAGTITLTGKGIQETRNYSGDYDIRLGGPGTSAGVTAGSASNITLVGIGTGVTDGGLYFYNSDGGVFDYDILSTWTMTQLCGLSFNSSIVKSAGGDASWTLTSSSGRITFLNTGGGITSTSGALSLTLDAGQFVSLATSGVLTSNGGTITLSAASYITMGASTQITSGGGDIVYRSRSGDAASGYIYLDSGSVTTSSGGNITLGGGSGALSAGNGFAVGSGVYNQPTNNGIYLASSTTSLNAGGGNIVLNGQGGLTTYGAPYNGNVGIWSNGIITTSGAGTITLTGKGIQETRNYSGDYDIRLGGPGTSAGVTAGSASNITLVGLGADVTDGGLYFYNSEGGVLDYDILTTWTMTQLCGLSFNSQIVKSTGGDASWTLTSTSGRITFLNTGGGILSTSGVLTLSLNAGQHIYLGASGVLNGNGGAITLVAGTYISLAASSQLITNGTDIMLHARSADGSTGYIALATGASIVSSGGNITLGGGSGVITAGNGFTIGTNASGTQYGISLASATIDASGSGATGGNIILNGIGGYYGSGNNFGVYLTGSTLSTNNAGTISVYGTGGTYSKVTNYGVYLTSASNLTTAAGAISISGVGGLGATIGIYSALNGSVNTIGGASATGTISILADAVSLGSANLVLQTTTEVIFAPLTASTTIGVLGGAGALALTSDTLATVTSASDLTIGADTDTGLMTVEAYTPGRNVKLLSGTGDITITGAQTMGAYKLTLQTNGALSASAALIGTGILHILPSTTDASVSVAGVGSTLNIPTAFLDYIQSGWANVLIGNAAGTGAFSASAYTWNVPVTLQNGTTGLTIAGAQSTAYSFTALSLGDLTIGAGGSVTSTASGTAIVLSAKGDFLNYGTSAVTADNGRWIIYSTKDTQDTSGGLSAAQALYGYTYDTLAPEAITTPSYSTTQNTWVYSGSYNVGAIIISASNQTVEYGTTANLTALLNTTYACSGAANACSFLTGTPVLSIAAGVTLSSSSNYNAGTWLNGIEITTGTLAFASGYEGTISFAKATLQVNQKAVLVSDFDVSNKIYDGQTTATITSNGTLQGLIEMDSVSLNADSVTASFDNANAGTDHTVTGAGYLLTGTDAANYVLAQQPTATNKTISPHALTITAADQYRVYGFGSLGTIGFTSIGLQNGETIGGVLLTTTATLSQSGNYNYTETPATIVPSAATGGTFSASNYSITYVAAPVGLTVSKKTITLTGLEVTDKVYDGSDEASFDYTNVEFVGVVSGDVLTVVSAEGTFNSVDVGTDIPVSVTSVEIGGSSAGNYNVVLVGETKGDISANNQSSSTNVPTVAKDAATSSSTTPSTSTGGSGSSGSGSSSEDIISVTQPDETADVVPPPELEPDVPDEPDASGDVTTGISEIRDPAQGSNGGYSYYDGNIVDYFGGDENDNNVITNPEAATEIFLVGSGSREGTSCVFSYNRNSDRCVSIRPPLAPPRGARK